MKAQKYAVQTSIDKMISKNQTIPFYFLNFTSKLYRVGDANGSQHLMNKCINTLHFVLNRWTVELVDTSEETNRFLVGDRVGDWESLVKYSNILNDILEQQLEVDVAFVEGWILRLYSCNIKRVSVDVKFRKL